MSTPPTFPFLGLIGVARRDITPPVGIRMRNWAAAKHDVATGVHRPLTLTCLTFQPDPGALPLVLIGVDLTSWKGRREDEMYVRGHVLEGLGLPPSHLLVNLSHTHAGPTLIRDDAGKPGGQLIGPYLDRLREAALGAAREALANATEAVVDWRYGRCDLATNRDLADPGKPDRVVCGYNPGAPADDTLLVGRVTTTLGYHLATIVNYACHPTTLAWENAEISPDYVGAMRELVEGQTRAPCLFLQGASGELAPAEQYTGNTKLADRHGRRLGHAVAATLLAMPPAATALSFAGVVESGAPLAVWKPVPLVPVANLAAVTASIDLPLKDTAPLKDLERDYDAAVDPVLKERLYRKIGIKRALGEGATAGVPAWCWRIGEAVMLAQPNEAYSEFQVALRRALPGRPVAVMNVTNGSFGYLPPREMYARDVYQVHQSPFAAGSLELLIERSTGLARRVLSAASA